jgi:hypothetical protein
MHAPGHEGMEGQMMRNCFCHAVIKNIIESGKMTFSEIKAYALRFYDESALMRRGASESQSKRTQTAMLCRSGAPLTERQHTKTIGSGASRIMCQFVSQVRLKKYVAKYPGLVVDDIAKEVRNELRQ